MKQALIIMVDEHAREIENFGSKPSVVAHACHLSPWEAEAKGSEFEASLGYLVRPPSLKETQKQNKISIQTGLGTWKSAKY